MFIQGTIKEFRAILNRAMAMKATAINFVFPNHAVTVSPSGEYAYFKTSLFLSHSAVLPMSAIENLNRFFKVAHTQRSQVPQSPFYNLLFETVTIRDHSIEFDKNPDFTFEIETAFVHTEQVSTWTEKIESIGISSITLNRPYLKLKPDILDSLYFQLKSNGVDWAAKDPHSSLNHFTVKDQRLIYRRDRNVDQSRFMKEGASLETAFDEDYVVLQEFERVFYPLYDSDIVTFRKLCLELEIDTIVLIPFSHFYIIEGHGSDLICKFHSKLRSEKSAQL